MNNFKDFVRVLKRGIEECKKNASGAVHPEISSYHREVENAFSLLGWSVSDKELVHETRLERGTNKSARADFTLQINGLIKHVIEIKRPGNVSITDDYAQLQSYMRLTKTQVGLLISDSIEVFYEDETEMVLVMHCELEKDSEELDKFVELFTRSIYDLSNIIEYCKAKIRDREITKSFEEYISVDNIDTIVENIKCSFKKLFSSQNVDKRVDDMITTDGSKIIIELASVIEKQETPKVIKTDKTLIKCHMSRHCDANGLFNPKTGELTVLAGSKINSKYPGWIKKQVTQDARNIKQRIDDNRKGNTKFHNNELYVINDVKFQSPSGASSFCAASSTNGYVEWKDENGNKLMVYRRHKVAK